MRLSQISVWRGWSRTTGTVVLVAGLGIAAGFLLAAQPPLNLPPVDTPGVKNSPSPQSGTQPPAPGPAATNDPPPVRVTSIAGLMLGTNAMKRIVIQGVTPDSSANRIGVKNGDLLVSFDGHLVTTIPDLITYATKALAAKPPGEEVKFIVSREGRLRTLVTFVPERAPLPATTPATVIRSPALPETDTNAVFCMHVVEGAGGQLIVERVLDRSLPQAAGILPRDVIVSVGNMRVGSIVKLQQAISAYPPGNRMKLGLLRGDRPLVVELNSGPCLQATAGVVVPLTPGAISPEALDRMSAKLKAIQAQIEDLRVSAEGLAAMIDTLRQK